MIDLQIRLREHSTKDSIDALYYAARFIKQSKLLHLTLKDVFNDDRFSLPSDQAKVLAQQLVADIEANAGVPAAEFSKTVFAEAVEQLFSAMEDMKQDFSPAEIAGAELAIASMTNQDSRF